jgi:hypothetical protein
LVVIGARDCIVSKGRDGSTAPARLYAPGLSEKANYFQNWGDTGEFREKKMMASMLRN